MLVNTLNSSLIVNTHKVWPLYHFLESNSFDSVNILLSYRVRDIISVRAGLKKVPWDGYLKYSRPRPKHREQK